MAPIVIDDIVGNPYIFFSPEVLKMLTDIFRRALKVS